MKKQKIFSILNGLKRWIMLYHIVTFGCQMNVHESEKLAGVLEKLGYSHTDDPNLADIIVFNTCAIREGAEDRAFGNIGNLKQRKKENPNLLICVCGCMTQQKEVQDRMFDVFKFVDIVFGTHDIDKFEEFVKRKLEQKKRIKSHIEEGEIWEDFPIARSSGKNAWVNIMYGCNNFCSYCIVPYVRGREKSRDKEEILKEVKSLVESQKYDTITLLGQNVNSYGNDTDDNYHFADLLKDICKIPGDFHVGFMTSHPKDIDDRVIDVLATESKMLKELHLPVQSGNDRILKLMNRNYTIEKYLNIVKKLREKIPNIRLSTDIIVGFPGETEEEFMDTVELVKNVKYDQIFAFMYSPRPHTRAAEMPDQISQEEKNRRVNFLLNLQKTIQKGKATNDI